ncbi:MAG: cation:dicarboxylase symporter family transporter [Clostridiales bacterium]|nr:cation:dicarboxylase symporter family transporter [Clostridiales bacterium]
MIKESQTFEFTNKGIDNASEASWKWLQDNKINRESAMRSRYAIEDILLDIMEHSSGVDAFSVKFGFRFGQPLIIVEYEGEQYNPLESLKTADNTLLLQLLQKMDYGPSYSYRRGHNEIVFRIEKRRVKSEVLMIIAVILAIVLGLAGNIIPPVVKDGASQYALGFISDLFQRMLGIFSGIMIFVILINGICGMGNVSEFSKIGKTVLSRYILFSVFGGSLLAVIALPFFDLQWGGSVEKSDLVNQIYEVVIDIIPSNPVKPFYDGNMMQIVFLAIFVGIVLLTLEGLVDSVKVFVRELDLLITKAVGFICRLLPLFIFASLLTMFWDMGFGAIISLWKPIILSVFLGIIYPVLRLIYISVRYKISPLLILRRISKSLISAFTTASSVASFQTIRNDLVEGLGVDGKLVDLSYPIGMQLHNSNFLLIYLLVVLVMAESYHVPVSIVWIVLAVVFSLIFSAATPCVSGGTLICIGIMMSNLSIPDTGLALAGTLSILLDFVLTMERVFALELELYMQARRFGMLDEKVLRTGNE